MFFLPNCFLLKKDNAYMPRIMASIAAITIHELYIYINIGKRGRG